MEENKDNANPTILLPSDLPSRHRENLAQQRKDGGTGLFDQLIPAYGYPYDPFAPPGSPPTSSEASDSDSEDMIEPIDEQEIYDLISSISDPEHPLTLGSLAVVNLPDIHIQPHSNSQSDNGG